MRMRCVRRRKGYNSEVLAVFGMLSLALNALGVGLGNTVFERVAGASEARPNLPL